MAVSDQIYLFIFPYAGGAGHNFRPFVQHIDSLQVVPLEYPGRGKRIKEPLLDDIHKIVEDAFERITPYLENYHQPYYFFGHSMGTLVAYLLTLKLVEAGYAKPQHIFVSGRGGPASPSRNKAISHLPSRQFRNELQKMEGFDPVLWNNEDFMAFVEPILRADVHALESYEHVTGKQRGPSSQRAKFSQKL